MAVLMNISECHILMVALALAGRGACDATRDAETAAMSRTLRDFIRGGWVDVEESPSAMNLLAFLCEGYVLGPNSSKTRGKQLVGCSSS
jgi:hypothetical protein